MGGGIKTFEELPRPEAVSGVSPAATRRPEREIPLVGVIRNLRSHRNEGREQPEAPGYEVITETTRRRRELPGVLDGFARKGIDYLVISGGDGTVRDVLTCGAAIFGDDWPPLIVLPKGKTNALAADLGAPADWMLPDALAVGRAGKFVTRRPLVISEADDPEARVYGFLLGAGVFHRTIRLGQDAHRWGAFNAAAVSVTTAWALGQALLAGRNNPWRKSTRMRLTGSDGTPLEGSDERYIMIAATLENLPGGLKPFGPLREGLKVVALDQPTRRNLLYIPLVAIGRQPKGHGYHRFAAESFGMDISEPFILDGEAFPPGRYTVGTGPALTFVAP